MEYKVGEVLDTLPQQESLGGNWKKAVFITDNYAEKLTIIPSPTFPH